MQPDDFGQTPQEIVERFKDYNEAAWHPYVIEEKITSPGDLGVDATGIEVRKVFGRHMEFPWEITRFMPGGRVTTRSAGRHVVWETTYLLKPFPASHISNPRQLVTQTVERHDGEPLQSEGRLTAQRLASNTRRM